MADSRRLLADALTGLMECKPLVRVPSPQVLAAAQGRRRTKARSRWHLGSAAHCREHTSVPLFAFPRSRCRAQGVALSGYLL